jgi:hypothetical protein
MRYLCTGKEISYNFTYETHPCCGGSDDHPYNSFYHCYNSLLKMTSIPSNFWMETPIAYPNIVDPADDKLNYVVNDRDGTIRRKDVSNFRHAKSRVHEHEIRYSTPESACGMSSVSEICAPTSVSSRRVVIVTTPVTDRILAVTRLETFPEGSSEEKPIAVHVDFGVECTKFTQSIVAIHAFPCPSGSGSSEADVSSFQLVLVDAAATILTLRFTISTLAPICVPRVSPQRPIDVRCWSLSDSVFGGNPHQIMSSLSSCTKHMVAFSSSDILVVALNPYLIAVDLFGETFQTWSFSTCIDAMRKQQSSLGLATIFSKGKEYIWGKSDTSSNMMDMNPVAAVCVADNDPAVVFSLHSDGVIRHWTMSSSTLLPVTVQNVVSRHIPSPTLWNSDSMMNSICLSARLYDASEHQSESRVFLLMVQIQSSIPIPYDAAAIPSLDDSDRQTPIESEINLIAIEGLADQPIQELLNVSADYYDDAATLHATTRLTAPDNAAVLLDMQLDPQSPDRCQLKVMYYMNSNHGLVLCTYLPSSLSILSRDPVVVEDPSSSLLMDSIMQTERKKVEHLSFLHILESKNLPGESLYFELDRRYLQYLFRPTAPRGNGTILSPSPHHLYNAMNALEPSIRRNMKESSGSDIAVDVALWIQEWRRRDQEDESFDESDISQDCPIKIQQHEKRWRSLLLEVWEQEQIDLLPLAMSFLSCHPNGVDILPHGEGIGLLVRPGFVSLLSSLGWRGFDQTTNLDKSAWELISDVKYENFICDEEATIQNFISHDILEIKSAVNSVGDMIKKINLPPSTGNHLLNVITNDQEIAKSVRDFPIDCCYPGLGVLSIGGNANVDVRQPHRPVFCMYNRLAAASLVVRGVDTMRRLSLARYVLLNKLKSKYSDYALYMYLHATAVLYVSARMTPSTFTSVFVERLEPLNFDGTFENSLSPSFLGLRGNDDGTCLLDPLLTHMSQRLQFENLNSLPFRKFPALLSRVSLISILVGNFQSTLGCRMSELGIFPSSAGEVEHPEGAIRLLSVRDSVHLPDESREISSDREKHIALCLIEISTSYAESHIVMDRVFKILPFDLSDLQKSMDNLRLLESQIGENYTVARRMLKAYVRNAIDVVSILDIPKNDGVLERLYGALFYCALSVEDWIEAFEASLMHSTWKMRYDKFKRLVRAMVHAGAISDLFHVISKRCENEAIFIDFNDSVAEALSEMTSKDPYTAMVIASETSLDCSLALYTFYASQEHWRKASEVMDRRYFDACEALATTVPDLRMDQRSRRESLIMDDLAFASVICFTAMNMLQDQNSKFLVSNGHLYFSLNDLELRAKRCNALLKLYDDKSGDPSFPLRALAVGMEMATLDRDIVNHLFFHGFYADGIELAAAVDKAAVVKFNGRGFLSNALTHLISSFLLPMALDDGKVIKRPTVSQLEAAIETFKDPRLILPSVFVYKHSLEFMDEECLSIRRLAMLLVEVLTVTFTTHKDPLAKEVAREMLSSNRICTPLPSWLESLLMTGKKSTHAPGMFARRTQGYDGYLGDPEVLLNLYMSCGLFKEACRVVTAVFDLSNRRVNHVSSRLPEKGEIDYIPIDKIDFLWKFVDEKLRKNSLKGGDHLILEAARDDMRKSIEKYFELSRISEMGQKSARVLS